MNAISVFFFTEIGMAVCLFRFVESGIHAAAARYDETVKRGKLYIFPLIHTNSILYNRDRKAGFFQVSPHPVFVTGSGASTAVLFGPLQAASASQLGLSPEWLCAANLLGAGIGKMIAPSNIALATASSGMTGRENEILGGIFKYCILYTVLGGIICFALA